MESKVVVPAKGAKITIDAKGKLIVPTIRLSRLLKGTESGLM